VDFANKSSCAAADHTHSDFLLHRCFLFGEMVENKGLLGKKLFVCID
jgi:hypothetical protein